MASPSQQLPPGWAAQWDANQGRYLFIESATGRSQWEVPGQENAPAGVSTPPPQILHSKRRQYAAGQTQAYYGADGYSEAPYGAAPPVAGQPNPQFGAPAQAAGGQLFTPGLAGDNAFQGQQQQQQSGYYGQQPQQPAEPEYINAPGFGQGPAYQPPHLAGVTDQFGQMNLGGQKPHSLYTVNLFANPVDPRELHAPPPEIRLPPNSSVTNNPYPNPDPSYQRATINAVPTTSALLNKSKVPFGIITTPYRSVREGDPPVPLVTDTVIARCRRCRAYINPFVQFIDGGNRWKCTMCMMSNEVPQMFDWDQEKNQPGDRWSRPELNSPVVEFLAPTEYMVRAPQPTVYAFLIDVSHAAVASGMVATACRTLLESLDRIPNEDGRTKIAIIGFDVALYFFSMPPGTTDANMLVVSDLDDVFLPKPTDLLVNLKESRESIETLLSRLSDMFADSHAVGSAMGPAMQAGFKLISAPGGKLVVLSASLPNLGAGALKNREDAKVLGTAKESGLLQAASSFYKTFAIDCSRAQVTVDMFLFSSTYQDVATLACLPHYTSGETFFYPAFNAAKSEDAIKFAHEFGHVLAMPIMLEAIMRIRASKNLRLSSFHGNFFVRSTDLLAMPTVPQDQSYAIEIQIEDNITTPFIVIQTAILHSTCNGERRIRVVTSCLPTTSNLSEVYASVDQIAVATLLANKAVERTLSHKLEDARDAVTNKMVEILTAYKASMTAAGSAASAQLSISENMKSLPVILLGLLKNVGLRQSAQIPPDLRAYAQTLLTSLPSQLLIPYLYPTFFSLHNMPPEAGTVGEHGLILPPPLPLTSERLERHGLFLIEDGQTIFLWVGRDAVHQLIIDVFDLPSYDQLRGGKTTLPLLENPFSQRINAIVAKVREMRRGPYYPHLYVVKEDGEPPLRLWALSCLIQDRADVMPSYQQYLNTLKDKVNGSSYS